MFLTNLLRPRTKKHSHRPTPRSRLGVQQLEDRTVPSWLAQVGSGPNDITVRGTEMEVAGNLYVSGNFSGTVDFDPGAGTTPHMTSSGKKDGYLAKFSTDCTLLWAKRFGAAAGTSTIVYAVSVDPTGQWVYVTGQFTGSADFTGDGVADKTSVGGSDVFVLKLAAGTGVTSWFKTIGSAGGEIGKDIAVTGSYVYVTGAFEGSADFDPGSGIRTLTPAGTGKNRPSDAFVLKLDSAGNHVSSWQIGGKSADVGDALVVDGDTVYLAGSFGGTADFDPGTGALNRISAGNNDFFLASYGTATATPTLNWVQVVGNAGYQSEGRLAGDSGSLYFTGEFYGTLDFDPGSGVSSLTSASLNYADVFAARYTKAGGAMVWANGYSGLGGTRSTVTPVVDEQAGSVYFGGAFDGFIDLKPGAPGGEYTTIGGSTDQDGFLVRLGTADGTYQNSWRMGGPGFDGSIRPIGVRAGTVYTTGWFEGTATFPTGGSLTSQGASDLFLMALDQFTAGPAFAGSPVTLTASNFVDTNPATTTAEMAFYADGNGDGILDPLADTFLGYGSQTASGTWAFSIAFPTGTYRLFAQVRNNFGILNDPLALDVVVL